VTNTIMSIGHTSEPSNTILPQVTQVNHLIHICPQITPVRLLMQFCHRSHQCAI